MAGGENKRKHKSKSRATVDKLVECLAPRECEAQAVATELTSALGDPAAAGPNPQVSS